MAELFRTYVEFIRSSRNNSTEKYSKTPIVITHSKRITGYMCDAHCAQWRQALAIIDNKATMQSLIA